MIPLEGQVTPYSESVDIKLKKSSCRVDSEYELEKYNTFRGVNYKFYGVKRVRSSYILRLNLFDSKAFVKLIKL